MKAIKAAVGTSQSIITETEFKTIFYKIPELHLQHSNFLECLKRYSQKWEGKIGDSFKNMVNTACRVYKIRDDCTVIISELLKKMNSLQDRFVITVMLF